MTFNENERKKAETITRIFETSRAEGDYAAVAVLDDGAGISYGINQFTHRSGSLHAVIERYLASGGVVAAGVLAAQLARLADKSGVAILRASRDASFKSALRAAAVTSEMRQAQDAVAFDLYMRPAIAICERYEFTEPLSLAVIYDSVVHGSFFRIARSVGVGYADEREWIAEYVARRDAWLASYPRLRKTRYRTRFFLGEIERGNWKLELAMNVHGVAIPAAATRPVEKPSAKERIVEAVATFDRVEAAANGAVRRADSAKSLWTTVGGIVSQAVWGVVGFLAGIPREVWITVAIIAACLMLLYLYRQIVMGRLREQAGGLLLQSKRTTPSAEGRAA
jgi:chitosanase